ncbi:MAG: hypothetical protein HYY21_05955 [Candidatus Tectomicrobia bacterium]|nr:hypothetical protein [Candidatus Tectomicrobia bacterium]
MAEGQPARPANIQQIVAINQGRLPLTMSEPAAEPFAPAGASRLLAENPTWRLLDVREPAAFGAGHVPNSVHIPVSSDEFEQRVGWVFAPETPFLLLGESEGDIRLAMHKMAFLGLDQNVRGYVSGGMAGWMKAGLPHDTLPQIPVHQLHERLTKQGSDGWRVVDVREDNEWAAGHIQGACHINYKSMGKKDLELPLSRGETLAVVCARGTRSSTGASLLRRHGYRSVLNVVGGMDAWRAAGYEAVRGL